MASAPDHIVTLPPIPRPTPNRSDEATKWLGDLEKAAEDVAFWEQPSVRERMAQEFKDAGL
jgi:hypothetical protein